MRNHTRIGRLAVGLLWLPLGLMLTGCGGSSGTISGKVSYRGQPVKGGTVAIIPKAGGAMTGVIQEDGAFTITKVPPGSAVITVDTAALRPVPKRALPGPYAKMPKDAIPGGINPSGQGDKKRYVPIPGQYANPEKSGLSYTVSTGSQQHDLDLK